MPIRSPNVTSDLASFPVSPGNTGRPDVSEPGPRRGEGLTASFPPSQELVMWNRLTPRERDVLYGIARGQSNKEIAALLGIGIGTVKAHVKRMFLKLGVHDRVLAPLVAVGELEHAARLAAFHLKPEQPFRPIVQPVIR